MRMTLDSIDQTLTASQPETSPKTLVDKSFPFPEALQKLSVAMLDEPGKERRVLRPRSTLRRPARHHDSDSGLGTSVVTSKDKAGVDAGAKKEKAPSVKASTVTRSAAASTITMPGLSARATSKICEHVLKPLLAKPNLKTFHSLVIDCPRRIKEKEILCLRDLEKTLLLIAPVSELQRDTSVRDDTYQVLCSKESTKTVDLYLDFCLTTVRCVQATVEYLSDREQTRPRDIPYTNGYFIDLVEQIQLYAKQLAEAKENKPTGDNMDADAYADPSLPLHQTSANRMARSDEIKLHGGIHINGRPAELVRVKKDGKAISLATGEVVEIAEEAKGVLKFKRSASEEAADEDEIMRSMARRKKNASPEELAPKKCREPGCNKEFKRPCDLTKHEKTHSRPWKCPIETCKYHEYGWPTEKEMDRHCNDKHSIDPPMYRCMYSPCPYKSKRESNCKQHMEKAHGWQYVRTKTNGGKKTASKAGSVIQSTPQIQGLPTPVSNPSIGMATPPEERLSYQPNNIDFPAYHPEFDFNTLPQQIQLDPMDPMEYSEYSPVDNATPITDSGLDTSSISFQDPSTIDYQWDDIYSANQARIPEQAFGKDLVDQFVAFSEAELFKSLPAPHISPVGQGNAMLFTPHSLADVDESFDDVPVGMTDGADFLLFPPAGEAKQSLGYSHPPLFGTEIPSVAAGYSQPNSQEFWDVDWSTNAANGYSYGSQH